MLPSSISHFQETQSLTALCTLNTLVLLTCERPSLYLTGQLQLCLRTRDHPRRPDICSKATAALYLRNLYNRRKGIFGVRQRLGDVSPSVISSGNNGEVTV